MCRKHLSVFIENLKQQAGLIIIVFTPISGWCHLNSQTKVKRGGQRQRCYTSHGLQSSAKKTQNSGLDAGKENSI